MWFSLIFFSFSIYLLPHSPSFTLASFQALNTFAEALMERERCSPYSDSGLVWRTATKHVPGMCGKIPALLWVGAGALFLSLSQNSAKLGECCTLMSTLTEVSICSYSIDQYLLKHSSGILLSQLISCNHRTKVYPRIFFRGERSHKYIVIFSNSHIKKYRTLGWHVNRINP